MDSACDAIICGTYQGINFTRTHVRLKFTQMPKASAGGIQVCRRDRDGTVCKHRSMYVLRTCSAGSKVQSSLASTAASPGASAATACPSFTTPEEDDFDDPDEPGNGKTKKKKE